MTCGAGELSGNLLTLQRWLVLCAVTFVACTTAIIFILVMAINTLGLAAQHDEVLERAHASDTHMRSMIGEIHHRAMALQKRAELDGDGLSASELQYIIMLTDKAAEYPRFNVRGSIVDY